MALTACGSSKHDGSSSTTPVINPNNTPTGQGEPGTTGNANQAINTNQTINPNDASKTYTGPAVATMGRIVGDGNSAKFNWAGTSFTARPAAQTVTINLSVADSATNSAQYMDVFLDGANTNTPIKLIHGTTAYPLTLPDTNPHIVTWQLRTEANFATDVITYSGVTVTGGTLEPTETPSAAPRQIEFIGDSITVGYGVLSAQHNPVLTMTSGCSVDGTFTTYVPDSSIEDASLSFATLTAKHFGAQYSLVASSGRGVWRNAGSNSGTMADPTGLLNPNMTTLWPLSYSAIAGSVSGIPTYTPTGWSPQVVVINLGTNDFAGHGTTADPNANPMDLTAFAAAYGNLIVSVNKVHPSAIIVPVVGPMLTTNLQNTCITAIQTAVAQATTAGVPAANIAAPVKTNVQSTVNPTDTGCEYHPLPATQADVASSVVAAITAAVPAWN